VTARQHNDSNSDSVRNSRALSRSRDRIGKFLRPAAPHIKWGGLFLPDDNFTINWAIFNFSQKLP
jgi:hypothetical protein